MAPQPITQTRFIRSAGILPAVRRAYFPPNPAGEGARATRSYSLLHAYQRPCLLGLQRTEQPVRIVERIVNNDAVRKQCILQRRRNGVDRRGSTLPHTLGAAVAVRRRSLDVPVFHLRHIHRSDWNIVAEG